MPRPNLDDYVDVAERIQAFKEAHPDGSLRAKRPWEVREVGDKTFIVYTALAYRGEDDKMPGEGTAWEPFPGQTSFTRNSELMNAETAAWGRAIAALGFETRKGIATRQDVEHRRAEQEEQPQAEEPTQNGGIPLTRLGELRSEIEEKAPSRDELGLMLVTVGIEHGPVIDALANERSTLTGAQIRRAAQLITTEQADALMGALDTGELS